MSKSEPTFIRSAELDARGPYQRERRRLLELAGLYPPRIRFNCRVNVWIRSEVLMWERAKAAGADDEFIGTLIRGMVASRAKGIPQEVSCE